MSVLVDSDILDAIDRGVIVIEPFNREGLGTNSYDVHLADTLRVYDMLRSQSLDVREKHETCDLKIHSERGFVLEPGELYLASTVEYTESNEHLPILNGKCFAPGTKVWMADGKLKNVEDVKPGHYVLGVNDDIRQVQEVHSGIAEMFRVDQSRGMSYVVNGGHELVLRCGRNTDNKRFQEGDVVTMSVREFVELPENIKKHVYGFRSSVSSFMCDGPLVVDPYLLGVWLGDGTSDSAQLTINNNDDELLAYLRASFPLAKFHQYKPGALTVVLTTHEKTAFERPNSFLQGLRSLDVVSNKHIPKMYLLAALRDRLALLAGLLDTDGSPNGCGWEITTKFPALRDGIVHLATSVGLTASVAVKVVEGNEYQRINISGDVSCIPVKLSRKRDKIRESKIIGRTDSQLTVTPVGVGEFYGFSLEGDQPEDALFLLEDFTVVHNSSLGRLGLSIHITAGTGDVGFQGHWTMEMFVIKPLRIYAGMPIGQILWFMASAAPDVPYNLKRNEKYNNRDPLPQASKSYQEQVRIPGEE